MLSYSVLLHTMYFQIFWCQTIDQPPPSLFFLSFSREQLLPEFTHINKTDLRSDVNYWFQRMRDVK